MPIYKEDFYPIPLPRDTLCVVKAAGRLHRDPHYVIERNNSETTAAGFLCAGRLFYEAGSACGCVEEGRAFLLPSHTSYCIRADAADPPEILWANLAGKLPDTLVKLYFGSTVPIIGEFDASSAIAEMVEKAQKGEELGLTFHAFLLALRGHLQEGAASREDGPAVQMERYITASVQTGFSVERLANEFGLSCASVNRIFRERYHTTPYRYYQQVRHEIACSLLRGTDLPLEDLAARLGFFDRNHFTASFLRREGIPPASYRRRSRSLPVQK
jgi:AraC-like DNA-binding protein